MKWVRIPVLKPVLLITLTLLSLASAQAQTTQFTYQGNLSNSGSRANGNFDFEFKLFDTATPGTGTQQGSTIQRSNIAVANGAFTVQLDFGACPSCFNGADRYLEIGVKASGAATFTTLSPRQQFTSTPYAIKSSAAATADGLSVACVNCVTSSQIASVNGSAVTGTLPVASLPAGSASYIQNTTAQQASSNFNISGDGTVGGTLSANNLLSHPTSGNGGLFIRNRTSSNFAQVVFQDDTNTYRGYIGYIGANAGLGARNDTVEFGTNGKHLTFRPNETEAMRLTTNGDVFIGADPSLPVGARLQVQGIIFGGFFTATDTFGGIGVRGVAADSPLGIGVEGLGPFVGVQGISTAGTGVRGVGTTGVGVYGVSSNGNDGVVGESRVANRSGVYGFTTHVDGCGGCFENRAGGLALGVTGTARVSFLQITGGSDLAEHFEVAEGVKPGLVVAIDPQHAGKLTVARGAYNRRAAGVISGAGNLSAGMVLPDVSGAKQSMPVALSGRVWVYCDAARNPIRPGDLLTTSRTPGHAMKVTNYTRAQGAIIGKAMTGLKAGRGLVLVLVTLQ